MRSCVIGIAFLGSLLCATAPGHGQQATERFIPIGQSPGLSGRHTYIGPIRSVDAEKRTLTVSGPSGERTVEVTPHTRIWLDRTGPLSAAEGQDAMRAPRPAQRCA